MGSVSLFVGTRPDIIKMAPVLLQLQEKGADYELVFSGQHYDYNLSRIFFEEFGIHEPTAILDIETADPQGQFGSMVRECSRHFSKSKTKLSVVIGDTNTTLAAALASAKMGIPIAHIEAGCRAFDMTIQEEVNRVIVDRLSSLLFAPTPYCHENLLLEGVHNSRICMFGNTNADVFKLALPKASKRKKADALGLDKGGYVLATLHRPSNVDAKKPLSALVESLVALDRPVLFPVHPRTKKNLASFGLLEKLAGTKIILSEPLSYFDFLSLLLDCEFVFSDSGGVMEDAALAGKRCLVPRVNVEWYELVYGKLVFLCHTDKSDIQRAVSRLRGERSKIPQVYTEDHPSGRIADCILEKSKGELQLGRDFSLNGRVGLFLDSGTDAQATMGLNNALTYPDKKGQKRSPTLFWKDIECW